MALESRTDSALKRWETMRLRGETSTGTTADFAPENVSLQSAICIFPLAVVQQAGILNRDARRQCRASTHRSRGQQQRFDGLHLQCRQVVFDRARHEYQPACWVAAKKRKYEES